MCFFVLLSLVLPKLAHWMRCLTRVFQLFPLRFKVVRDACFDMDMLPRNMYTLFFYTDSIFMFFHLEGMNIRLVRGPQRLET